MSIVIPTRINQTAAQWALDATVYSINKILVTTDVFYGATDQPKFKLADGVSAWSALDYMPIDSALALTLAQVLANGNKTNGLSIESNNTFAYLSVLNAYARMTFDNGVVTGGFFVDDNYSEVAHEVKVTLNTPNVELPQETADLILSLDASKNIKGLPLATYPSKTELSYVKGVTSSIQTQLDAKNKTADFFFLGSSAIADSTTYYWGTISASPVTALTSLGFVPLSAGVIKAVMITVFNAGTVPTNENATLSLFYNDGAANTSLATDFKIDANRNSYRMITGLSISVSDGGGYMRMVTPVNYSTNSTGTQIRLTLIYV